MIKYTSQGERESAIREELIVTLAKMTHSPNNEGPLDEFAATLSTDTQKFDGRRAGIWLMDLGKHLIKQCTLKPC